MIATVAESATLRDGKTVVHVGDVVQVGMKNTYWQIVAISGLYDHEIYYGIPHRVEPHRKVMVRKLFSAKLVFKPETIAECAHESWICLPSKRKREEISQYFQSHPQDRAVADDFSRIVPGISMSVAALVEPTDGDYAALENTLRSKVGYPVDESRVTDALEELRRTGAVKVGCRVHDLDKFTHWLFVRGYEGCMDERGVCLYEKLAVAPIRDDARKIEIGNALRQELNVHGDINVF